MSVLLGLEFGFSRIINSRLTSSIKMSLPKIISNNKTAEELLNSLKEELNSIRSELIAKKKRDLLAENIALTSQIDIAKSQLIALEIKNGKKQIPIPYQSVEPVVHLSTTVNNDSDASQTLAKAETKQDEKPQKEKKQKKEKPVKNESNPPAEAPIDVGRLDFRVGKIVEVSKHPDADSLYLEKIDVGEPQPRTVVSGLVKFVPIEEMQNRMVVVLCNLKPAKMRGITSEAMVMCASTPEKVEVLSPPPNAVPGDLVYCEGYERAPDTQLNPKKKIFETCAPDLMTNNDLVACFKGTPLHVPGKGNVVSQTLKNVNVK
ncbi:aminoacyl tRNA synthase complex-interacting multifunctional protein 1 [Condylostylus longicornis]|uniref:aminoacyl tRNA synthase complex-interacting multifunctional protein 1 n=1 Tax=Condylostylus longicornis TaxID=2530218 RepID=UPI00244DCB43|nr:aminoacyl tRNA synthase complex-interacting multifunctional protein 1 [Condylostylus longicornis]